MRGAYDERQLDSGFGEKVRPVEMLGAAPVPRASKHPSRQAVSPPCTPAFSATCILCRTGVLAPLLPPALIWKRVIACCSLHCALLAMHAAASTFSALLIQGLCTQCPPCVWTQAATPGGHPGCWLQQVPSDCNKSTRLHPLPPPVSLDLSQ